MRCAWEKRLKETKSSEMHFLTSIPTTTPDHHRREENIHIQANKLGVIRNRKGAMVTVEVHSLLLLTHQ